MGKAAVWMLALLAGAGVAGAANAQEATAAWTWEGLQIDFTQSMQNWDNTAPPLRISGSLTLDCHWASDARLACTTSQPPTAATVYRIGIPAGLRTQTGVALPALDLAASTERPRVSASVERWRDGVPQLQLFTALKVSTAETV